MSSTTIRGLQIRLATIPRDRIDAAFEADIKALEDGLTAVEVGAGLETNGSYVVGTSNYLGTSTTLKASINALDAALFAAAGTAGTAVQKAGDSMTGNLVMTGGTEVTGLPAIPSGATAAASKSYVDSIATGLTWETPVQSSGAATPATATAGDRFLNLTDGKVYTATATNVWNTGELMTDGAALFDAATETGYVYSGSEWVQFTGAGQVVAGLGLLKTANQIDINMGAGIAALPTDEVGVDVLATGGLFTTVDGTASSTDTAAQLAIKLNGTDLVTTVAGLALSTAASNAVADAVLRANFIIRETPVGAINGTNALFTIANTPYANSEQVFLNGMLLESGVGNDYEITGKDITLAAAPLTGDRVKVSYFR